MVHFLYLIPASLARVLRSSQNSLDRLPSVFHMELGEVNAEREAQRFSAFFTASKML